MTLFGLQLSFHWCTQEWVRVLLSLSGGEKVGVCVLSSINSTLWPTRPSAHPLLLVFPLVLPNTLVAWQYAHSLRSGCLHLSGLQLTPPSCRMYTQTHSSPTHTLCISLPSHVAVGQSQSFSSYILFSPQTRSEFTWWMWQVRFEHQHCWNLET